MTIDVCSKFTEGTIDYSNCKTAQQHKAKMDADCNERIKAARKNSLEAFLSKYDCKEKSPSETFKKWEDLLDGESWQQLGESLISPEAWEKRIADWSSLESWKNWATPENVALAAMKAGFLFLAIKGIPAIREVNFLRQAAIDHPNAHLGNAVQHQGVAVTPPRRRVR